MIGLVLSLAACAGPRLPPPNTADARYDARDRAVRVTVSGVQPIDQAALVSRQGSRYPASALSMLSAPHVLYNPPPSIGFGIGGFGVSDCCTGFGSGIGLGLPIGQPTVAEASDQYVALTLIPVPADYATNWADYHVEVATGGRSMSLAAPAPVN